MNNVNRMALGELNPHRAGLAAADAAGSAPANQKAGFSTLGYRGAIIEAVTDATSVVLELFCWSEAAGKFVKDASFGDMTMTGDGQWTLPELGGRWCWIFVKTMTGGTTLAINVGPSEKSFADHA